MVLRAGRRIEAAPKRKLYRAASGTWGAAGYILTKDAAARLLEVPSTQHTHIDWFLFKPTRSSVAAGLTCYQVLPAVCIQDEYLHGTRATMRSVVSAGARVVAPPPRPKPWTGAIPGRKRPVPFKP